MREDAGVPDAVTYRRTVQFAETDMAGVLHFSNYFRYMEEAEHAFWRSLGLSVHMLDRPEGVSWPRVAVHCEYYAGARFEDELELRVALEKVGTRSVTFRIDFHRGSEHLARGTMTVVCCAVRDGRFQAVDMPPSVRQRLLTTGSTGA